MQLRMAARRSLNGSMTVVGDIAQATGPHAPRDWDDVLRHLPDRRPARVTELTVGYRIPAQTMALAARVLRVAAPGAAPRRRRSARASCPPVDRAGSSAAAWAPAIAAAVDEFGRTVGRQHRGGRRPTSMMADA